MTTYDRHHQSRQLQGIPPLTMEDPSSHSELNYPSSGNQSPSSNTESICTSRDSSLLESFFTEGFIRPYNPPITNLFGPLLIPVAPVLPMSSSKPIPTIPLMTNGSWYFVDTFGPHPLPQSIVSTILMMGNLVIPTIPSPSTIVTPNMSGTQYIPVSAPFVLAPGPLARTPYSSPYSVVSMGPFRNRFGSNPFLSSKP